MTDVLNRPFRVYHTRENTCLGAAVLAGMGSGCFRDIDDAVDRLNHQTTLVEPNTDHAMAYEDLFNIVYKNIFQNISPVNERIDAYLNKTN